ncbi:hypothetical protein WS83_25770 [Burkholderia sp. MSMB2042]|nr:hypothetical protein WS78_05705 [Burkholderia savannae]KVG41875.1 hypothetical protein WS77_15745 [Burkholderia sp. MSMB0265]KVG86460.1 hypothetical protein WS81_03310 [Burkholderia sp. MSMB2040]KVG98676.1 hypothetical protein WS82_26435 [Burkholderia sp. MSMB2041]KVG99471.1 hypothetical protein WS83_25770 [Burkholderia sp. MSMB2042]
MLSESNSVPFRYIRQTPGGFNLHSEALCYCLIARLRKKRAERQLTPPIFPGVLMRLDGLTRELEQWPKQ